MIYRKHRYLAPEPGDTGGAGAASTTPPTEPPPSTVVEPITEPAVPLRSEPKAEVRPEAGDTATKIGSLLDTIGKEVVPTPEPKSTAGETKTPVDETKAPAAEAGNVPTGTDPAKPVGDPKAAVDLTPPEGMGERAKTRWTELAERAKQVPVLEARATEAETQLSSVRQMVAESGLGQDEFAGMLQMGRLFKSDNPEDLKTALQQIDGLRADIATRLGVDAPGVDPLAKHPDLAADVEAMSISRERALELVRLRDTAARAKETSQSQTEIQEFQRNATAAAKQMEKALAERANTPGHAAKMAFINAKLADPAAQQAFVATYAPHQWAAAMLMMYDAYNPPAPATPAPPQPLRPGHVASGTRQISNKPVTSTAAVENAWEAAGLL